MAEMRAAARGWLCRVIYASAQHTSERSGWLVGSLIGRLAGCVARRSGGPRLPFSFCNSKRAFLCASSVYFVPSVCSRAAPCIGDDDNMYQSAIRDLAP